MIKGGEAREQNQILMDFKSQIKKQSLYQQLEWYFLQFDFKRRSRNMDNK